MSFDVVFKNAQVVNSQGLLTADVAVQDGKIAAIGTGLESAARVKDCTGLLLLPGAIDSHVHVQSSPKNPEGWERLSKCAAAGGVTTVFDMPYDSPLPTTNAALLEQKIGQLEQQSLVDAALYGTITKHGGVPEIAGLVAAGASVFKFSTYETDPQRFPRIPNDQLWLAMHELARLGVVGAFHAEDGEIIDALIPQLRQLPTASQAGAGRLHAQSRPPISEMLAVSGLLELARAVQGFKLHIVHLTIPEGFELLKYYRALGVDVTAETCIHYLTLNEDDLAAQGAPLKCNPPLRPKAMQEGLWAAILAGDVDFVTTDHAPWLPEQKSAANIFDNRSGMPGLEWLLPLIYDEGVVRRGLSLPAMVRLIATNPARRFGLTQKGDLQLGMDADLVLFDPKQTTTLSAANSHSIARFCPFEGRVVQGRILETWRRGQPIYADGQMLVTDGGRFVRRLA